MNFSKPLFAAVALASFALAAPAGAAGLGDGDLAHEQGRFGGGTCHGALVLNALVANALVANALVANALVANALVANALTDNALTDNALVLNALTDPNARDVLEYVVSCALPADETVNFTVDGTSYSYPGQLGLAPEWGDANGQCGNECQEWVSACLLARVDFLGVHREISVRGQNPGLRTCDAEQDAYPVREATYYGNVFASPQQRYACLSPGQTEDTRVCGPSIEACVVDVAPNCDEVCDRPGPDGDFRNCQPGDGDRDDPIYHGSITVFLAPGEP